MWSFDRRPPPYVKRKRRGTVEGRGVKIDFALLDGSTSGRGSEKEPSDDRICGFEGRSFRG